MYTKTAPELESGGAQSFRRVGYQIPASYAGNAFSADFLPDAPDMVPESAKVSEEAAIPCQTQSGGKSDSESSAGGLLGKLGSPELDDVLLIGLILLLSRERESSTGTLLLLALLLLA